MFFSCNVVNLVDISVIDSDYFCALFVLVSSEWLYYYLLTLDIDTHSIVRYLLVISNSYLLASFCQLVVTKDSAKQLSTIWFFELTVSTHPKFTHFAFNMFLNELIVIIVFTACTTDKWFVVCHESTSLIIAAMKICISFISFP